MIESAVYGFLCCLFIVAMAGSLIDGIKFGEEP